MDHRCYGTDPAVDVDPECAGCHAQMRFVEDLCDHGECERCCQCDAPEPAAPMFVEFIDEHGRACGFGWVIS